ncbi:Fe-S cluster assembly protein IscX [Shewanella gelidii]|uniref:Fe-S assembly protein IscX n=1 Tax=Shewanella gelidii TaxID=1642821 RepID=A0A917JL85_9GAMM|nr:Fe-S cluster assembly protein IscX [Shewanella gelidii]MCL1097512.1 Fe-S cluster assembly protein IscX [Shewanella gelidii]GGI75834.1 Fe-S assembly protein IscX [Shewanella gelidii]
MVLKWIDSLEIALALLEQYPDVDPVTLHFPELYAWIMALDEFDDDPNHCNERILEAVQQCWIDEK